MLTLASTKQKDGRQLVYQIKVRCYVPKDYPYEIEIRNFFAKCNGIIPDDSTRIQDHTVTMSFSQKEWLATVAAMERTRDIYVAAYGTYELKRTKDYIQNFIK